MHIYKYNTITEKYRITCIRQNICNLIIHIIMRKKILQLILNYSYDRIYKYE